ncbi:hypothetical protein HG530_014765 [Fusarium avenaceum]|nr:hypothetical protein HG530_014765 [Fusarium avenaceum]
MDIPPNITVYNLPTSPANWDRVGVFYITFCAVWTFLVILGMLYCWFNRRNQLLRVRGIGLSFIAIIILHLYWILGQIVYPIGRTIPTLLAYDIQYFFMGIWFPLGIALFNASNCRFLYVAKLQKQYMRKHPKPTSRCNGSCSTWLLRWQCYFRNISYEKRILILTTAGMVVQTLLTIAMWLACRKYHPTFGFPGTELRSVTLPDQIVELSRGWEWWSSVFWQVVWTWVVAPVLLWRAWGIHDTMGWRTQTIGCCLSNLHATPMFLISSYVPAFATVNLYFPPSQWIHVSVLMFEIFTIFVPAFQVMKQQAVAKRVLGLNASWDTGLQTVMLGRARSAKRDFSSSSSITDKLFCQKASNNSEHDMLLSMKALDHVLERNPGPLQDFSALTDFSGENVAFLTDLLKWKKRWHGKPDIKQRSPEPYNGALDIYIRYVSPRDAQFPLNLPSPVLKSLEAIFEKAARDVLGEVTVNLALPFEGPISTDSLLIDRTYYTGLIPDGFGGAVLDAAEKHIKYLILTNTWPKFVKEMRTRKQSSETLRSDFTALSGTTITSRISNRIRGIARYKVEPSFSIV